MNHGIIAQRGFYIQALICMLTLVDDNSWDKIHIEPENEEKIDFIVDYCNNKRMHVQVKSTINQFTYNWAMRLVEEYEKAGYDECEIVLCGECDSQLNDYIENIQNSKKLKCNLIKEVFNINELEKRGLELLEKYLDNIGIAFENSIVSLLSDSTIKKILCYGTQGKIFYRDDFQNNIKLIYSNITKDEREYSYSITSEARRKLLIGKVIRNLIKFLMAFITVLIVYSAIVYRIGFIFIPAFILVMILLATWIMAVISNKKYNENLNKEFYEYRINTGEAKGCRIEVKINQTKNSRRNIIRTISIENLYKEELVFIEGKIYFYQGYRLIEQHPFCEVTKLRQGMLRDTWNYVHPNNARQYWTHFIFDINEVRYANGELSKDYLVSRYTARTNNYLYNGKFLNKKYIYIFPYEISMVKDTVEWILIRIYAFRKRHYFFGKLLNICIVGLVLCGCFEICYLIIFFAGNLL